MKKFKADFLFSQKMLQNFWAGLNPPPLIKMPKFNMKKSAPNQSGQGLDPPPLVGNAQI